MTRTLRAVPRRTFLVGGVSVVAGIVVGCADEGSSTSAEPAADPIVANTAPVATDPPRRDGPASFVDRGPSDSDKVALTFHTNGDLGLAQQIIDSLGRYDAVGSSFVVGEWLEANPAWAEKLQAAGLELENHTYSHPTFSGLPPDQMDDEVGRCRDILIELTGQPGRLFRPSGTDDGTALPDEATLLATGDAGYTTVLGWDVEPYDYQDPGAAAVEERVLGGVTGGSIVSLHFGHPGTVDALDPILAGLAERGLQTVTAADLIGAR